jgi:hypothetical protein
VRLSSTAFSSSSGARSSPEDVADALEREVSKSASSIAVGVEAEQQSSGQP